MRRGKAESSLRKVPGHATHVPAKAHRNDFLRVFPCFSLLDEAKQTNSPIVF